MDTELSKKAEEKQGGGISETVSIVIQALLLAVVVRTFLFQPFTIPSSSMVPTLLIGDYLFVSKYSYGYSRYSLPFSPDLFEGRVWEGEPKRGQIAVFRLPSNPSVDYIKRVIGLPGDKVQMSGGQLYINGQAIKQESMGMYTHPDGDQQPVPMYRETLPNGISYMTLDTNVDGSGDDTPVFEVPAGHYFMMGDNRDNSLDSRFDVGFVSYDLFIGPARRVFFSVSDEAHPLAVWRWPTVMRTDRLLQGL